MGFMFCDLRYMFLSNNPSSGDMNLSCSNYAPGAKMGPPPGGRLFYIGKYMYIR